MARRRRKGEKVTPQAAGRVGRNALVEEGRDSRSATAASSPVATLVAGYRTNELPFHLERALENGVTKNELAELITPLAFYAGWPPASTAVGIARQVFAESAK